MPARKFDYALYQSDYGEQFAFKLANSGYNAIGWGFQDIPDGTSLPRFPNGNDWVPRHYRLVPEDPESDSPIRTIYVGVPDHPAWVSGQDLGTHVVIDEENYVIWQKCPEKLPRATTVQLGTFGD